MSLFKYYTLTCIVISFCLFSNLLSAQHRSCGLSDKVEEMLEDPEFADKYNQYLAERESILQNSAANRVICSNPVIIPVAVHYQSTGIPNQCMIDAAVAQIDQLNLDFSSCNANASLFCTWIDAGCTAPGGTQGAAAMPEDGSCFQFCIADQNLPTDANLVTATGLAITTGYNANNQNASTAWRGYLNMYVGNLSGGTLGFVNFLGGAGNANNTQGISTTSTAWGGAGFSGCNGLGTSGQFNNGATATHEVGHWFGLDHTFSETPNLVDTPPQGQPNFGCPNVPINLNTCNSSFGTDYSGNFMDYVDDDCMFMFSDDQVLIMINTVDQQSDWATNSISCFGNIPYPACNNQAGSCGGVVCYNNLTNANGLATTESGVADYESDTWINTSANTTIQAGASVDYDAAAYVQLDFPFCVNAGADFIAFIDGCNSGSGGINLKGSDSTSSIMGVSNDDIEVLGDEAIDQKEQKLKLNANDRISSIKILGTNGEEITTIDTDDTNYHLVDTSSLTKGVYFIVMNVSDSDKTITKKFVKL